MDHLFTMLIVFFNVQTFVNFPGKNTGVGCHFLLQCMKVKSQSEVFTFYIFTLMHWRRKWQPIPLFLPGESQGRGSLVGCHLWGCTESDMTERLHIHFSLSCIGEGNGNPLQCSCLENPRDGQAWWAAIYGAAQSRTRLKRLSSSSSSSKC